jgi:hypothetical protein
MLFLLHTAIKNISEENLSWTESYTNYKQLQVVKKYEVFVVKMRATC